MTDYQTLFEQLITIEEYPKSMVAIPYKNNDKEDYRILSRGFFPGGRGTYNDGDENISNKKIMILGQDFDCTKNYDITDKNQSEDSEKNFTWKNLLSFLKELEIDPSNCFFTNAIMGVRVGNKSTGKSPAFKDENFIKQCQELFLKQLALQKPKAIFVLGKYVAKFLEQLEIKDGGKLEAWKNIQTFAQVDKNNNHWKKEVLFSNKIKTNLVLLIHPSLRHANLHHRRLVDYTGKDVEVEMVKKFLESIEYNS